MEPCGRHLARRAQPGYGRGSPRRDITYLASDELEGRGVNTQGINLAADYIAGEFKKAGLRPGGTDGSFFQPFPTKGPAKKTGPGRLILRGPHGQVISVAEDKQFAVVGLSGSGKVIAPVVFAGYGTTAKNLGYDDFQDVDVADKVVLILRKTPHPDNKPAPFDGQRNLAHAGLATKLAHARAHHAAAVLFVNDRISAGDKDPLMDFGYTATSTGGNTLPTLQVRREIVDRMMSGDPKTTLRGLEQDIDRDLKPHSVRLTGWNAEVETRVGPTTVTIKNVIGVSEGSGPLARETVVVGGHYDHLGLGRPGGGLFSFLLPSPPSVAGPGGAGAKKPDIYHGADDNGSGTTGVMELARCFGPLSARQGRRIVFIAFTGEETGLLGSTHYCAIRSFPWPTPWPWSTST